MRTAIFLVLALAVVASAESAYPSWVYDSFDHWCVQYDKTFDSPSEREFRVGVFYTNLQHIEETNAAQDSYTLGLNGFSAMTVEEFIQLHTGMLPVDTEAPQENIDESLENVEYPSSIDWTSEGAVTGVKNQGQCGSCWAFSTTGGLEGLNFINGGTLESFSEQQIVDCSGSYGNYGCNGGLPDYAYRYTARYGVEGESTYPYTAKDGSCKYQSSEVLYKNRNFHDVTRRSSSAFLTAVGTVGPVSIGIDAEKIMSYTSGIFNESNCGTQLDHAVLAVGYDVSQQYIKVKNSWGTTWGESGYIRFALLGNGSGECGMYLQASYPTA